MAVWKSKQSLLELPQHKLINDVPTRWNSSYDISAAESVLGPIKTITTILYILQYLYEFQNITLCLLKN